MALNAVKVGCDPELFLRDKSTGKVVSAFGIFPGTKHSPHKVNKGAIQVDGTAFEFNIDPAETEEAFHTNITTVLDQAKTFIPESVELTDQPTAIFDPDYFKALPEEARLMGCDPDFNAYTGKENVRPTTDKPMRTAGGHIHIGWRDDGDPNDADHMADCIEVVRQMDFYLGLPSLSWDSDSKRRELYGKAGAFRVKTYGVEYRPLSCMWVLDPTIRSFVFKATQGAIRDLYTGHAARLEVGSDYAKNAIDKVSSRDPDDWGYDPRPDYFRTLRNQPFFHDFDCAGFSRYCEAFKAGHKKPKVAKPLDPLLIYQFRHGR